MTVPFFKDGKIPERLQRIQGALLIVAFTIASICLCARSWAADRPNILMLFADDLGRYASAYTEPNRPSPNDIVSTPVFDRVASEGVLGLNVFASAPSCTPSRSALVSGRHFFRNGAASQLHNKWFGPDTTDTWRDVRGYAQILHEAGYHTGLTYKDHVKNVHFGTAYNGAGAKANKFSQFVSGATDHEAARQVLFDEVRNNFRAFLKDRKDKQPFLYSFHPTNPHRQWVAGSGRALWGLDPESLDGKLPPFLPNDEIVRQDFADYLGEGMAFDAYCGVLIDELERLGELDNTLVVISGDHGAPGFPRGKTNCYDFGARVLFAARWPDRIKPGQVLETPISLIDIAPTFLAAAKISDQPAMNGQNLLPALHDGEHSSLRGWALIGREVHVHEARDRELPYPTRAIRTPEFLYLINFKPDRTPMGDPLKMASATTQQLAEETRIGFADMDAGPTKAFMVQHRETDDVAPLWLLGFGLRPAEELFDVRVDPFQMNNLADDPAYAAKKRELRKQLLAELTNNNDPRVLGDQFDAPPYCRVGLAP